MILATDMLVGQWRAL